MNLGKLDSNDTTSDTLTMPLTQGFSAFLITRWLEIKIVKAFFTVRKDLKL